MKEVDLSQIAIGKKTSLAFYSRDGHLLLSQDVMVEPHHIEALRRNNNTTLYVKDSEDDEIQKLIEKQYTIEDIELDGNGKKKALTDDIPPEIPLEPEAPKALELAEFKGIKSGREGFEQLNNSSKAADIDKDISSETGMGDPSGPPLSEQCKEIDVSERTEEYKGKIAFSYSNALSEVALVMNTLANGHATNGRNLRAIVERFVETFVNDKNILLNISGIKPRGQDYLYNHTLNVCLLSINIAAANNYSREQVVEIGMGALLHDVGMLLTPKNIRLKKGRLDRDELFEIHKHSIIGLHLLENVSRLPRQVPIVAYQNHERDNKLGYPKRRSRRLIHSYARIVQIADVFEALSSPRVYRPAFTPYKGMEALIKLTRKGFISGELLRAFLTYSSLFPVGSLVELSSGSIARVIKANGRSFTKPNVSVLTDNNKSLLSRDTIYQVDLTRETDTSITHALPYGSLDGMHIMDGF
ncbi:MAG: HD domain-containing protein [Chitinivibrionales bacterium]|nr:HD domain-containing protein [Chitinivibrionales bacterium]